MSLKAPPTAIPQDQEAVNALVAELRSRLKGKKGNRGGPSLRSSTYKLPSNIEVESWKLQDWDYKKPNLPTHARGLFTRKKEDGNHEIVVRGYDKFFNPGEVKLTQWPEIEKHATGPFELSVKENGCIIFISAIDHHTLIVCSKTSTGPNHSQEISHSQAGEDWLKKHLEKVGKSEPQLASCLRAWNVTAIAELCDDSFEEHVLAYSKEKSGLYLHGINLNLPNFITYPHHLLAEFADEWGFLQTEYLVKDTLKEAKEFLDAAAKTGTYNGRDTEGFVIRCRSSSAPSVEAPFNNWFFKYKFDEPYLMFREWREATRALIAGNYETFKKKNKRHGKSTQEYIAYAARRFAADPDLKAKYKQNRGIIALRNDFLRQRDATADSLVQDDLAAGNGGKTRNIFLVPIATLGCGKTTLGVALCRLFKWRETQNDDIVTKKKAESFFTNIIAAALDSPVVFADRNNSSTQEREQVVKEISNRCPDATFVALHWDHPTDPDELEKVEHALLQRLMNRKGNHQTISSEVKTEKEIHDIQTGFLRRYRPFDHSNDSEHNWDSRFDFVITLNPLASARDNIETVISQLYREFPKLFAKVKMPSANEMNQAVEWALNEYVPRHTVATAPAAMQEVMAKQSAKDRRKNEQKRILQTGGTITGQSDVPEWRRKPSVQPEQPPKPIATPRLQYFSVRVSTTQVLKLLEKVFEKLPAERAAMYQRLQQKQRIQREFHCTLMHRAQESEFRDTWGELRALYDAAKVDKKPPGQENAMIKNSGDGETEPSLDCALGRCKLLLKRLVWDDRLMAFTADLVNEDDKSASSGRVDGAPDQKWHTVNKVPHVTVGTASAKVLAVESNKMLGKWSARLADDKQPKSSKFDDEECVDEDGNRGVLLEGTVYAVVW